MNTIQVQQENIINASIKSVKNLNVILFMLIAGLLALALASFLKDYEQIVSYLEICGGFVITSAIMWLGVKTYSFKKKAEIKEYIELDQAIEEGIVTCNELAKNPHQFKKILKASCMKINGTSSEEFKNYEHKREYSAFVMEYMDNNSYLSSDEAHNILNYCLNTVLIKDIELM